MTSVLTVLNVGDDLCYRIPVMEHAGLCVVRSRCSVTAVQRALTPGSSFSGIVFHTEIDAAVQAAASAARQLSTAPLILFQNSSARRDERLFDLVIPAQTPPVVWLKSLQDAISEARDLCEKHQKLCQDFANLRSTSAELRRKAAGNRDHHIDIDALWRGKPRHE